MQGELGALNIPKGFTYVAPLSSHTFQSGQVAVVIPLVNNGSTMYTTSRCRWNSGTQVAGSSLTFALGSVYILNCYDGPATIYAGNTGGGFAWCYMVIL